MPFVSCCAAPSPSAACTKVWAQPSTSPEKVNRSLFTHATVEFAAGPNVNCLNIRRETSQT